MLTTSAIYRSVVYSVATFGTLNVANLDCKTNYWANPDWQAGQVYSNISTVCKPGMLHIQA
jgi:hypothetical protein